MEDVNIISQTYSYEANFSEPRKSDSEKTRLNSTGDNISYHSNDYPIQNQMQNQQQQQQESAFKDLQKLAQLINLENQALNFNQNNNTLKKPTFNDIKNNISFIQHNLDSFFSIPSKKISIKKNKKEEEN